MNIRVHTLEVVVMFAWGFIVGILVVMFIFPALELLLAYLKLKVQSKAQKMCDEGEIAHNIIGFQAPTHDEEEEEFEEE